jgi:uncharacterized membrane protein
MDRSARVLAIMSTGLLAGAFAYAFFAVVPTFNEVPLEVHFTFRDALMRRNGIYMQVVMGLSILTPLWWAYTIRGSASARTLAISASLLSLISFLVTRFGNVPINQMIKTWSAATPPPGFQDLLQQWLTFHNVRTATAVASFLCVAVVEAAIKKQ